MIAAVRQDERYVPVPGRLRIALAGDAGGSPVEIADISLGGAFYLTKGSFSPGSRARLSFLPTNGPGDDISVRIVNPNGRHGGRPIVRFAAEDAEALGTKLRALREQGALTARHDDLLRFRELGASQIATLKRIIQATDGLPPDASALVERWIQRNQRSVALIGPDAWTRVYDALMQTFRHHYVSWERFRQYLQKILAQVKDRKFDGYHAVPLRALNALTSILAGHEDILRQYGFTWHPTLWSLANSPPDRTGPEEKLCLVAVDTYLHRGINRRHFLRLLTAQPSLVGRFAHVFVVAIVGYEDQPPLEIPEDLRGRVDSIIGHQFPLSKVLEWGPLPDAFAAEQPSSPPGLVVFYYGTPFDSLPLYWQQGRRWQPLFRPLEYYNPVYRPIARAPFFVAYPKTLENLRQRAASGGVALLHGPQGAGKTYLAARLAEIGRDISHVFWYRCRPFDAVENVVDELDAFLRALGIDDGPAADLYKRFGEVEAAEQIAKALGRLDRPALLVFDGIDRLDLGAIRDGAAAPPFGLFLRRLIFILLRLDITLVTPPFLLLTHGETPPANQHPSGDDDRRGVVERWRQSAGLPVEALVRCPMDRTDVFADPVPLARQLIQHPDAVQAYAELTRFFSNMVPYRTWLVCYWLNRCVRLAANDLAAAAQQIDAVLDPVDAPRYETVDTLHRQIIAGLEEGESQLLSVASAWTLPWSVAELDDVMRQAGMAAAAASKIVDRLLVDHAPFLTGLGHGLQGSVPPFAVQVEDVVDSDRFEMPSIAARFFAGLLDRDPRRPAVYRAIANIMDRRLARLPPAEQDDAATRVLRATLHMEAILCLCNAKKPSEAGRRFLGRFAILRGLNSPDRLLQIGVAILNAAKSNEDVFFTGELRCGTAAVHANGLVEAFRFSDAREICDQAQAFAHGERYWEYRLRLIKAKCLRYESDYETALQEYSAVRVGLAGLVNRRGRRDDATFWLGRTLNATAQCFMSLGRLDEATRTLDQLEPHLNEDAMSSEQLQIIRGLELRHRGTIELLRGNLDEADRAFSAFAANSAETASERARVEAIASYRRAQVLLERSRQWEAAVRWRGSTAAYVFGTDVYQEILGAVPSLATIVAWLEEAGELLDRAWWQLRQRNLGDLKWLSAIELCRADAWLIQRRLMRGETDTSIESTVEMMGSLKGRAQLDRSEARGLDLGMLENSLNWQRELEQPAAETLPMFATRLLDDYRVGASEEVRQWIARTNPHKQSEVEYQRMYYLWRVISVVPRSAASHSDLVEAAARAYRRGTSRLYAHGMARSAHALHRLAVVCFGDQQVGLQELLEAATCLAAERTDPGGVPNVGSVLRLLTIEAVRNAAPASAEDRFFTIPTKIICRFVGDHSMYLSVVANARQPDGLPVARASLQREELRVLARGFAMACRDWFANPDWGEICRKAQIHDSELGWRIDWARQHAFKLTSWLTRFVTDTRSRR